MRRTFTVIDIVEILNHWYSGRSQAAVARSLGVDRRTVKKYVSLAERAGISPGGPPIGEEAWRAMVRGGSRSFTTPGSSGPPGATSPSTMSTSPISSASYRCR